MHDLHGLSHDTYGAGIACLVLAILWSVLVVMPQLRRRNAKREWAGNMIYFGHLRHWPPELLGNALRGKRTDEHQLARQLVTMSQIAWKKHARLQRSIVFLIAGVALLFFAYINS